MELVGSLGLFDSPRVDVEGRGKGTGDWPDGNRLGSSCGGAGSGGDGILGLLVS